MQLTFYGVRGSYPIARRNQVRYGGNTTCLHFQTRSGQELILDGGSGIRLLGQQMMGRQFGRGEGEAHILVGHTHWDHILGYPFFAPFMQAGNRFVLVSAGQTGAHLQEILSGQQTDLHFPVSFDQLTATLDYKPFTPGDSMRLGDYEIETVQLNHPGITVGYRISADMTTITVFTDTAPVRCIRLGDGMGGPQPDPAYTQAYTARIVHCARQSDLLVHDTHFLAHEIQNRYDWGHSTVEEALALARLAAVKRLALFHYSPTHSDTDVDAQLLLARDLSRNDSFDVIAAAEGQHLVLGPQPALAQEEQV